jgi:hypothetical protein
MVKRNGPQHAGQERSEGMKQRANDLAREIKGLEGIEGASHLAGERQAKAAKLMEQSRELEEASQAGGYHGLGGLHCQASQKGREEIRAMAGRLAGRQQAVQVLPGELQEAEPDRGPAEGQEEKAEALGICL